MGTSRLIITVEKELRKELQGLVLIKERGCFGLRLWNYEMVWYV